MIDASNAGVILDGSKIHMDWVNGLSISSDGNTIQGLQIVNFSGSGIAICSASYNKIGGNRNIGDGSLGQGNLVGKNGIGIDLCDKGSNNTITGNIIGTDLSATEDWGNKTEGIWIENGITQTIIGPDNTIAFNGTFGIRITGINAYGNKITQNSIHDNSRAGIQLWDGGNAMLPSPIIFGFEIANGVITGSACANCTVEILSDKNEEGAVYEGSTIARSTGHFDFTKIGVLSGPQVFALATDRQGNTSEFSPPSIIFQAGNTLPETRIIVKPSGELEDNRIGVIFTDLYHPEKHGEVFPNSVLETDTILKLGYKKIRLSINNDIDSSRIDWTTPEFSIDPRHDQFITDLTKNGVKVTLVLTFWDKGYVAEGGKLGVPRFKTEGEIRRYLDFVRFTVSHFKDRIEYYEIWNEPTIRNTVQWIEVEDYINLARRAIPIIRQEYPEAKIVVGSVSYLIFPGEQKYLFAILGSDVMPLVDAIAWHPFYGTSPKYDFHRQYYYEYPTLVQKIKDTANAHGFQGEYFADEITWRTQETAIADQPWPNIYSEKVVAKYLARGIIMHLGMDVAVTQNGHDPAPFGQVIQNLCTSMAGAKPVNLPIEIESEAKNIRSYSFLMSNGDRLIALWTDGFAVDDDPGIKATFTIPDFSSERVLGIDVIHGLEQEMVTNVKEGNLVIHDVFVKDYPIILRFTSASSP